MIFDFDLNRFSMIVI